MGNLLARFRHRDVRVILLGLDSAGKTSILYRLKLDDLVTTVPTIGFNVENIRYKDLHLTAWDIGSRDKLRPLFRHYYKGADAVVFVIDSHDPERLDELNYDVIKPAVSAEELTNAVFLFLANKTDLPETMTTEEIAEKLGLRYLKHPWGILPVSAANGEGLQAALEWLAVRLGSAQVKPRNFTAVQPKPKLLDHSPLVFLTSSPFFFSSPLVFLASSPFFFSSPLVFLTSSPFFFSSPLVFLTSSPFFFSSLLVFLTPSLTLSSSPVNFLTSASVHQ
ncbi:unnamed protein product [Candidula unifasciata]|uniref:ADP-ribosylation factor n=1 Tax=Candidula unifasciata TaxID=100452 RepID=A0A8S3ZB06_9EUPU|nr:unnamed protein product [Candidula unifasciata]